MKKIITSLTLSSLVVLAGCTTTQTATTNNTNVGIAEEVNTNKVAEVKETTENTNEATDVVENTITSETAEEVDTSDWLTFENEEYGFSFKYPGDWEVLEVQEEGLDIAKGDHKITDNSFCTFHIRYPKTDVQIKTYEAVNFAFETGTLGDEVVEQITVNNLEAVKRSTPVNSLGEVGIVYNFLINEKTFKIIPYYGISKTQCNNIYKVIVYSINKNNS